MRRKKHKEHANHERWLVSYADFITLLFAFFVVLYSSSQVDHRKIGKLQLSITAAFQELGLFQTQSTRVPLTDAEPLPFSDAQIFDNITRSTALGRIVPSMTGSAGAANGGASQDLTRQLQRALAPEILHQQVDIRQGPDGLVLSLREMGFYETGSDILRPNAMETVTKIVNILGPSRYRLRVEGHTDNVPIRTGQFRSNWELSTARATDLVHVLIEHFGFDPASLSAAGYAEFHPIATNSTPEGRQLNRRVDLVILSPFAADTRESAAVQPNSQPDGAHPPSPGTPATNAPVELPKVAPPPPQVVSQLR